MNGDVTVTVSGPVPISEKAITGVTITYGYNMIPECRVQLDAGYLQENSPALLCNPETYKKRDAISTIRVTAKTGCVTFEGYFDGLCISQSVGNFSYEATFLSKFCVLQDVYPRAIGLTAESALPFIIPENLTINRGNKAEPYSTLKFGALSESLDQYTLPKFVIAYAKILVKSQINFEPQIGLEADLAPILEVIQDGPYKDNLQRVLTVLEEIDTIAVDNSDVTAALAAAASVEMILNHNGTLWDLLVDNLAFYGCCLIPGRDRLYVVPQANFLKFPEHNTPRKGDNSKTNNVAYPADYNGFSVTDTGRQNYRACIVLPEVGMVGPPQLFWSNLVAKGVGVYPSKNAPSELPDDGAYGVLIVGAPDYLTSNQAMQAALNITLASDLDTPKKAIDDPVESPDDHTQRLESQFEEGAAASKTLRTFLDYYAKLKLLQNKYTDRTGDVLMQFNHRWCPGTVGSLYMRNPGTFCDFFVTRVTHEISMQAPSSGVALTRVSFNSARIGKSPSGVEQDNFYKYNSGMMQGIQNSWINGIKA